MKLFDFDHPFFRPLWVRVAVVAFAFGWSVFEFIIGSPFWGMLFCAVGAFAFYGLFISFNPREHTSDKEPKS